MYFCYCFFFLCVRSCFVLVFCSYSHLSFLLFVSICRFHLSFSFISFGSIFRFIISFRFFVSSLRFKLKKQNFFAAARPAMRARFDFTSYFSLWFFVPVFPSFFSMWIIILRLQRDSCRSFMLFVFVPQFRSYLSFSVFSLRFNLPVSASSQVSPPLLDATSDYSPALPSSEVSLFRADSSNSCGAVDFTAVS